MDLRTQPTDIVTWVRTLESALEVLHMNLTLARQYLATLFLQEP